MANNKPKIIAIPDTDGNPAFAMSHSDGVKVKGESKTLTQKMAEVEDSLDGLDSQINGHTESTQLNAQDSSYALTKYIHKYSDTNIQWLNTTTFINAVAVPIESGSSITIVGNATNEITYVILKTCDTSKSPSSQMVTGLRSLAAGGTVTVDATEDGHFLYMQLGYSGGIKYPQSVTQSIYTPGMKDQFDAMNKFQTGENLADVPIEDELTENSNGLVKSGCLFDELRANIELKYDTPLLTGVSSYDNSRLKISAGKTVYDEDIVVTKLIFNKNIESAATDTTFTYYVALPNSNAAGLGTAYTGTITAGTNYANVNIEVPTGKIIYVQNKKVVDGGTDAYPTGCLIAGNSASAGQSYAVNLLNNAVTAYAGFSYEYYFVASLKEYIDFKDNKTNKRIDEYHTNKVLWSDAKTILAFGSSLTDQRFAPAGHIWLEEINNLVDANIVNYALSGSTLAHNISTCIGLSILPNWILWNNQANGTPFEMNGYIQLSNAREITGSKGAVMLLGGENSTANGQIPLVNLDRLFDVYANDNHIPHSELRRELVENLVNSSYQGFDSGVHRGWRTQSPFITKHLELLGNLPIDTNVKIFKVRPNSANLEVSALAYDTPLQRVKHFYAISTGVAVGGTLEPTNGTFPKVDNIGQSSSYYADVSSESRTTILTRETETFRNGGAISIPYGKAVVEFVLDKENVTGGKFSFGCSVEPQVYVSISHNSSTSYTDSPRSTWQLVDVTYADYDAEVEVSGKIELGDKVKFLVVGSGSFTIAKPSFEYKDGRTKKTPVLNYKPRRYGTELNSNRNIDSNDWQLGGNAAIKQISNTVGYYAANTSHIELTDNGDFAERTVTIPAGTKKVAIRVMATRFVPIMTKRFVGTDAENSEYVSTTQVINNYDCDLGVMDIVIDDAAVSRQVICPGFAWSYVEYATELTATSLTVRVRKPDNDTAPTMVYMLSVQAIE